MKQDTRLTIHAGVNFIVAPPPTLDLNSRHEFEKHLDDLGIKLSDIKFDDQKLVATRKKPPLQITIGLPAPQVGQILIVVPNLGDRSLEVVGCETKEIAQVFMDLWPKRQIVACDATIRDLYDSTSAHAFEEIWEGRLKQPPESLQALGRPVLGGGLRFVMPSTNEEDPTIPAIELKIESYMRNTYKIYLEAQFNWRIPQPSGHALDPEDRLIAIDNFIQNEVVKFVMEE